MSRLHRAAGALGLVLAIALAPAANAQNKDPVKIAIGVDAAYVPLYLSKQNKLFENGSFTGTTTAFCTLINQVPIDVILEAYQHLERSWPDEIADPLAPSPAATCRR